MNKWQMSNATVVTRSPGMMFDSKGRTHFSIHPHGKRARNQSAARARREANRHARLALQPARGRGK